MNTVKERKQIMEYYLTTEKWTFFLLKTATEITEDAENHTLRSVLNMWLNVLMPYRWSNI